MVDIEYFLDREAQERMLSTTSRSAPARRVHTELADRYAMLVAAALPLGASAPPLADKMH